MLKKIFGALALALAAASSLAQFAPNQVLRAQALNAALAAPTITAGSINGAPIGASNPRGVTATTVYAGTVTSPKFVGTITGVVTGTSTYAASAGTAAYAVSAGTATVAGTATAAGTAAYAVSAGTATVAGTATAAGTAAYAVSAGNAFTLNGTTFASPGPIGATTPSTGAFSAGSAAAPSVRVGAGAEGVYSIAAGSLGLAASGQLALRLDTVPSSVNYLFGYAHATGNSPTLRSVGSDTNVDLTLGTQGTGAVDFLSHGATTRQFRVAAVASAVNFPQVTGAATGLPVVLSTGGSDTNRSISIAAAGTGTVRISGHQVVTGPTAPTVASGAGDCGTSPAIAGRDGAFRVTVGSSTNGGVCTVTFGHAWATAPVCTVANETTSNPLRPTASTTALTLRGTLTAGDSLVAICVGY